MVFDAKPIIMILHMTIEVLTTTCKHLRYTICWTEIILICDSFCFPEQRHGEFQLFTPYATWCLPSAITYFIIVGGM